MLALHTLWHFSTHWLDNITCSFTSTPFSFLATAEEEATRSHSRRSHHSVGYFISLTERHTENCFFSFFPPRLSLIAPPRRSRTHGSGQVGTSRAVAVVPAAWGRPGPWTPWARAAGGTARPARLGPRRDRGNLTSPRGRQPPAVRTALPLRIRTERDWRAYSTTAGTILKS